MHLDQVKAKEQQDYLNELIKKTHHHGKEI